MISPGCSPERDIQVGGVDPQSLPETSSGKKKRKRAISWNSSPERVSQAGGVRMEIQSPPQSSPSKKRKTAISRDSSQERVLQAEEVEP